MNKIFEPYSLLHRVSFRASSTVEVFSNGTKSTKITFTLSYTLHKGYLRNLAEQFYTMILERKKKQFGGF